MCGSLRFTTLNVGCVWESIWAEFRRSKTNIGSGQRQAAEVQHKITIPYAQVQVIQYSGNHSKSDGAHNTQRPLALPVAHRSTTLGCEHVTDCTAVILSAALVMRTKVCGTQRKRRTDRDRTAWRQVRPRYPDTRSAPAWKGRKKDVLCTSRCGGSDPYSPPCSMHVSVTVFSNDEWDRVP